MENSEISFIPNGWISVHPPDSGSLLPPAAVLCLQCQVDTRVLRVPSADVLRVPGTEMLRVPSTDVLRAPGTDVAWEVQA